MTRKKTAAIIVCWTITALWAAVIFGFSAQPAYESEVMSGTTANIFFDLIKILFSAEFTDKTVFVIESVIRKIAHFGIFTVLGGLLYTSISRSVGSHKKCAALSGIIGLLYAASDEIHQLFVPGRSCQITDVLIDFSGVLTGILLVYLIIRAVDKRKSKKAADTAQA